MEYSNANICSILDFTQVSKDDNSQLNFEDLLEETKEEEAPKLELKSLPEELRYAYPVVISSRLTSDQEGMLLTVLKRHRTTIHWTLKIL